MIVAVVLNSISHDARVLKEASALVERGYRAVIVGIQDAKCAEPETIFPDGVRAIRIGDDLEEEINIPLALVKEIGSRVLVVFLALVAVALFLGAFLIAPEFIKGIVALDPIAVRILALLVGLVTLRGAWLVLKKKKPVTRVTKQFTELKRSLGRSRRLGSMRRAIAERVIALGPDTIHCHDVTGLLIGEQCLKLGFTKKMVYDSHELYEDLPNASAWHKYKTRSIQEKMAPRLSGFITINDSIARVLRKRHPRLPEPVIVKNAVRCPSEPIADDGRLRDAAGLDESKKILLYQGGYSRKRGLHHLVRSIEFLPDDWIIVMMGWGMLENALRSIALDLDPDMERIRFIPRVPQDELVYWTAGADVGIIPYERFGLNHWFCTPNKLWEYTAAGLPILASPFPELRRIVEGEGVGLMLTDPIQPEAIAWTLKKLTDKKISRKLRKQCRAFIERDNWSVYSERLVGLYEQILPID